MEWSLTAMLYFAATIVPALLLAVSLLIGDAMDDIGLDIGDADSDAHFFSAKLALGFICGFGAGGLLGTQFQWPIPHWATALIGGLGVYAGVFLLILALNSQKANTQSCFTGIIGQVATVKYKIASSHLGEIAVVNKATGQAEVVLARGHEASSEFSKGQTVKVIGIAGGVALVEAYTPPAKKNK